MQMKSMYLPVNRKARAALYRRASKECGVYNETSRRWEGRAPDLAEINHDMAVLLDPPPRAPRVTRSERRSSRPPMRGPDHSRVGGQLDAPPKKALRERTR